MACGFQAVRPGEQRLVDSERPDAGVETVEVRARTSYGDISIRRVPAPEAGGTHHDHHPHHTRPPITATGLRKSFGDKVVLDGIDLEVAEGTVFALLGPNGAGKTTRCRSCPR